MDTIMDLMSEDGTEHLKSRPYQSQLEEIAIRKNTIIHLPTGSGKTFIAVRLIKRFRGALQMPWGEGGKRTFFLVNTVPLVLQQKKVIEWLCPVNGVGAYSSEDKVDYWDKRKWDLELSQNQVIVMTSQILCDMITHAYIRIEDINLLIFDECHHAVEDHPMRLIMKHFDNYPAAKLPRVLGLTATLLNANVKIGKVEETLRDLETTFHATIATVNELGEVLNYSTNPFELVQFYKPLAPTHATADAVKLLEELEEIIFPIKLPLANGDPNMKLKKGQIDITRDPKKIVKAVKNIISGMSMLISELGVYGGSLGILAYIILLERLKRKSNNAEEELMYKIAIAHSVEARMVLLDAMKDDSGYAKIVKHSSAKVLQMLNVLKEYNPTYYNSPGAVMKVNQKRKRLSAIIFTQQRFMAKVLYNLLKDVKQANPADFGFLKHDFIVGFNVNPFKSTREQHYLKKASQKALLKFSNKELNCLISTSVIEEGVDISQCLLVLRYDPPIEYRSYIQSKGRARSADSSYVMLVNEADREKFMMQYAAFQKTERYIQSILIGSTDDRDAPTLEDIRVGLYDDDEIPPYITPNGNRLSSVSAISLLSRYCSTLPHDQFTVITPMWIQEKVKQGLDVLRLITIIMPIACPVKEKIQGMPLVSLKSAKRSAALNACIRLHQEGELDAVTLLPRHYGVVDFDEPEVKQCFLNWPWDRNDDPVNEYASKPGTKKMVRTHKKEFPSVLKMPQNWKYGQRTFYLHIIKLKAAFEEPKDSRERALFKLLQRGEGFALLTPNELPKLCDFPMFLTVGEVTTSLEMNYAVIQLDLTLFDLVKEFHYFIFDQVLEVAKKFLVYDGGENSMFVVPIKEDNGYDIDWDVMQKYKYVPPVDVPSYEDRKSLCVTRESYQYCVVTPWYRGSIQPDRYIVSDVIEYMTPQSHFDAHSYGTYEEYYSTKYNLEILGRKDQPLLEARNISSRMNCLMPRAATIDAFSEKQQKLVSAVQGDDKPKAFTEFFIPEFCIKYDFPGVLWYKAILLPSIVHRVFMLLVAHDLREEIALATKYGKPRLTREEQWMPIQVDKHIVMRSLLSQIEEPTPMNTIDRINNPIDDSAPRNLKIVSMKETVYQLQNKKLSKEYPWEEKMEPVDIERNLSEVTVMDIECYDEFVCAPLISEPPPRAPAPPSAAAAAAAAAILPPPAKYNDKIELLSKQPTGRGPELRDVLAALTTINSSDSFDLERVETLGDSFLKFAASTYLFHKFPKLNEGQLTNIKSRLIGNRNLYYAGERIRLGGRMKVELFSPRKDFLVPGFFAPKEAENFIKEKQIRPTFLIGMNFARSEVLRGELSPESFDIIQRRFVDCDGSAESEPIGSAQNAMQSYVRSQAVSDKSVADCVEALVGTYLLSGGIPAAVMLLEWMRVFPSEDNLSHLLHKTVPTVISENKAALKDLDFLLNSCGNDIERILNYKFKDRSFLLEAMSHPSYIRNRLTRSYERLEFLGDAILDFLITSHIFENCRQLKPGELTDLRSALVNNVTFASYVVKLGLYKFLCSQLNPTLDSAIMAFVEHQEQRDHEVIEDVLYLIEEDECHIAEYVEVPKVLSDLFESLTGAIFLDSGGDLGAVWAVVYRIMWKEIDLFSSRIPQQPVRVLYENIHACPVFHDAQVTDSDVPKVMIPVTVTKNGRQHTVHGFGGNKFQAKRAAAKLALKILSL